MDEIGAMDGGSVDDRGGAIERRTLRALGASGDDGGKGRPEAVRLVRQAIRFEATRISIENVVVAVAVGLVWVLGCCGVIVWTPFPRSLGPWPHLVLLVGSLVLMRWVLWWPARRRVERNIGPTLVACGFCGACGYSLAGLGAEEDGCVVCPECAAAWRESRVGRRGRLGAGGAATPGDAGAKEIEVSGAGRGPSWLARFASFTPARSNLITADDRACLVHVMDRRLIWLGATRRAGLGPERARALRRLVVWNGALWRYSLTGVIAFPVVMLAVPPLIRATADAWNGRWVEWDEVLPALFGLGLAGLLGVLVVMSHGFYDRRRAARALVNAGHCGSCLASLEGLRPESDGRVTCPDCGAGWVPRRAGAGTSVAERGGGAALGGDDREQEGDSAGGLPPGPGAA